VEDARARFAIMLRSNDSWALAISHKVAQVLDADPAAFPAPPLKDLDSPNDARFPSTIDHTLLTPDATSAQIDRLCDEAIRFKFRVRVPRLRCLAPTHRISRPAV
jgi:deoxyribose-phosphate aldolase